MVEELHLDKDDPMILGIIKLIDKAIQASGSPHIVCDHFSSSTQKTCPDMRNSKIWLIGNKNMVERSAYHRISQNDGSF
ncbi:MAG: hypothetical protein IH571_02210 [Acholeplasmataceae bacterium]|nr:hypothetical protein [Acholeplasmataceae bacterium]